MKFISKVNKYLGGIEFSAGYRWQHWIRAISIFALIATGFYIANPFITYANVSPEPTRFLQAEIRHWHIIFGFAMIGAVLYKTFHFFFFREGKYERRSILDAFNIKVALQQVGYYLLISKHPHTKGIYNPLQFWAYTMLYVFFYGIIITGLALYAEVYHNGLGAFFYPFAKSVETFFGGLAYVRLWHHIFMWLIIIVVFIHIYMAVYNAVFGKNGGMDAIFSGMKWEKCGEATEEDIKNCEHH
ncbi:Ni/Fe-hydrogenase, b-type cytochrome subunit [Caminibacter sp.]